MTAGTIGANTSWSLATTGAISVGTTALSFVQIGSSTSYSADNSTLQLVGSQFSEKANGTTNVQLAQMAANTVNPDHSHDFDAQVLVLDGEITIQRDGKAQTFRAGDSCEVPAGTVHAEQIGPQGVRYLAGRRQPA